MLRMDAVTFPLTPFQLDVSFETKARAAALFGPSGSGKTSILELIAGIRRPRTGRIEIDGVVVDDVAKDVHIRSQHRRVGYVPQGESLFPHLSVEANVRFGLRGAPAGGFLAHVIDVLEIGPLMPRSVRTLSGGEARRVALARALVTSPRLLLLDEPLAGLDRPLHSRIIDFLVRVRDDLRVPMMYVSHDLDELKLVVEDVIVIASGRVTDATAVR